MPETVTLGTKRLHVGLLALAGALVGLQGCTVTSPYWGYVPETTSTAIPFQAFTTHTGHPVVVECATATSAHGWPENGEASYITAANLSLSTTPMLDPSGSSMYSASGNVALPSSCWDYFGDYDFWQANIRVSQVQPNISGGGTSKRIFTSHDLAGLECLGRENGKAASWLGFVNKGCVKTYLNSSDAIPYIVLRIDGYSEGLNATASTASVAAPASRAAIQLKAPAADAVIKGAPAVQAVPTLTPEQVEALKKGAKP